MQKVSDNWKQLHEQTLLNESFVEVTLDIADPDALKVASPSDNGAIYISDSSKLADRADKSPIPYCTLEQNIWCLDGNGKAIPGDNFGDTGYVSDVLSNDTCIFEKKQPAISIGFPRVFSKLVPGVTIVWSNAYGEFPDTFSVLAYNGDTLKAEKEVTGNRSVKSLVFVEINDYNRIEIIIKKWCLPNHRARVEEIFVGVNKVYGKAELFSYSHSQSVDPISTSLPKAEINFSIDNIDGEYNPNNTEGISKYLTERQEVKARYGLRLDDGSVEWIDGGTFYLSEWYAKQNGITADFTARDLLEFMSDIYYDDDFVTNYNTIISSGRTLYNLALAVLNSANLPKNSDGTDNWVIDESLTSILVYAPLPKDTLANCLQLIANVGRCVMYQGRDGKIHIEPISFDSSKATAYRIGSKNSYSKPEITLSKPIAQTKVNVYSYEIVDGEVSSKIVSVRTFLTEGVGEKITIDNPLITTKSAELPGALRDWVNLYLYHRTTLDFAWRSDVRLDALDMIINETTHGTNTVLMTDVDFKYNGAFRGTGKGKVIENG